MLRITVHTDQEFVTLRLEGKLAGPWVGEAAACWRQVLAGLAAQAVRLDLTGVTQLDIAGKEFLAAAHAQGAQLVASGCLMRAIVAELTSSPLTNGS